MKSLFFSFLLLFSIKSFSQQNATVYYNGDIITMEGEKPIYAQAVVTKDGKIIYVGTKAEAMKKAGANHKMVDLKGKTMMPGFIEPHLHPFIAAVILPNEIIAPYDWVLPNETKKGVSNHDDYIKALTASINKNATENDVYWCWGYQPLWHGDLNRDILNKLSPDKPVAILHRSFHEVFLNDKAIEFMGIKEEDYKGNPQVDWKNGHFWEGGFFVLGLKIGNYIVNPTKYAKGLETMSKLIQMNGITTIDEPGFPSSVFNLEYTMLKKEMDKNPPYSVYLIPNGTQLYTMNGNNNDKAEAFMQTLPAKYDTKNIKFRPNQVKLFADGAIYSQNMQMIDGYTDRHEGQWITPPDFLKQQIKFYWEKGYKIHIHANGDEGIQTLLDDVAEEEKSFPRKDHRFTLHHMGYFTDAQAQQVKDLGMEASVNPYYLWALADKFSVYGLGKDRAENLVRIGALTKREIPVSFHSDFAMAPLEPLTLAWTAINRVTSQGSKFSQDQKLDAYTGMKGITITAARTLNLENEIGSIKVGKTANFTILAENPLKINPIKIKDIKILGTVFEGNSNFKN